MYFAGFDSAKGHHRRVAEGAEVAQRVETEPLPKTNIPEHARTICLQAVSARKKTFQQKVERMRRAPSIQFGDLTDTSGRGRLPTLSSRRHQSENSKRKNIEAVDSNQLHKVRLTAASNRSLTRNGGKLTLMRTVGSSANEYGPPDRHEGTRSRVSRHGRGARGRDCLQSGAVIGIGPD